MKNQLKASNFEVMANECFSFLTFELGKWGKKKFEVNKLLFLLYRD